jgi:hypothetical protein
MFDERVEAGAEFTRLTDEIVANRLLLSVAGGRGPEQLRAQVERDLAEGERKLADCGERILALAAAVEPDAELTHLESALAAARLVHTALAGKLSDTRDPAERETINAVLLQLVERMRHGEEFLAAARAKRVN